MGKKANRKRTMEKERRWPLRLRVLALTLAMALLLTSSGVQIMAEEQTAYAGEAAASDTSSATLVEAEEPTAAEEAKTQAAEPAAAEATVTAEAPASTEATVTTEAPASTETTVTTEAPAAETTVTTEAPASTETTVTTEAPASAETTATTEAPATTEAGQKAENGAATEEAELIQGVVVETTGNETATELTGDEKATEAVESETQESIPQDIDLKQEKYLTSVSLKIRKDGIVSYYKISKKKIDDADAAEKVINNKIYYELGSLPEEEELKDVEIEATFTFEDVTVSGESALLHYQIPNGFLDKLQKDSGDTSDGAYINGTYEVEKNGRIEITPDEDYLAANRKQNGTTVLTIDQVTCTGTYSEDLMLNLMEMISSEDVKPETEATTEAIEETETEAATEAIEETETEAATEAIKESETEAATEAIKETETEATTEALKETETEAATEALKETETEAATEALKETETEATTEALKETETEAATEAIEESETTTLLPIQAGMTMSLMSVSSPLLKANARMMAAASSKDIDLAEYLTSSSTMQITVYVDGVKRTYTPEQLTEKNLVVPKGAPVKVELYFDTISKVAKGQKLVYQLPDNLMDYSGANEQGVVWSDIVWEENSSGAEVEAADWIINNNGQIIVTIRDDFFEANKHDDDTVDLFGFNIKFSGSFSEERGEHSGNDDNVITFRGETEGTGNISFTIPFEYKNEHANVQVEKSVVNYDALTQTASYEIKVTAPEANTYTATDVVVTDAFQCDAKYIEHVEKDKKTTDQIYRNIATSASDSTFDNEKGIWTIGDMKPGQTETLTYDVVISRDAYTIDKLKEIQNLATVTFNDDGVNSCLATLKLPDIVLNKETISGISTDKIGPYLTYRLSVTANDGDAGDLTIEDAFGNASLIKDIVVAEGGATEGAYTIDIQKDEATGTTKASLTWTIDQLKKGTTATLTYKAYLNEDAWQTAKANSAKNVEGNIVTLSSPEKTVTNNAILYVGNDTDTPAIADAGSTENKITKTWVKKEGNMITEKNDPKYGLLKFTVTANGDPVSDNVVSIYDTLTSGGTYEDGGNLTVTRYTAPYSNDSDKEEKFVDTTTIPLEKVITTKNSNGEGTRWDLILENYDLAGRYYYEITYYVKSTGVNVTNEAGIGFGVGGYSGGVSVVGGGGMTYGSDYSKSYGTDNYAEGYAPWTVTVKKTIPAGAIYEDKLSNDSVYKHKMYWFDDKSLSETVITFNNQTLVQGVDYTITGVRDNENGIADRYDPDGKMYSNFLITFNKEFEATSSNPLKIDYKVMINTKGQDEGGYHNTVDGCTSLNSYNYCRWGLPEYGKIVFQDQFSANWREGFNWNTPFTKSDGTYNADDGTITWYVTVNTTTSINGNATLEEYLPEGLSFVSAEISDRPYILLSQDTDLGEITKETYTDTNGKSCVKVNIPIKNLHAYQVTSTKYATGNETYGVGPYTGWSRAGEITIKIVTKVDIDWYMNLTAEAHLTNKAVLTGNDGLAEGGITATGTATVPYKKLLDKSQAGRDYPAYVEYALNINPDSKKLTSGNDLEIVDIMGTGMSLSTDHINSTSQAYDGFKVYDVTNVSDLLDSGNVSVSQAQTGEDITSQCTIENITGKELNGMTEDDAGKPTYLITVPDGKHVVVIYWATFEGAEDEKVTVSNKASFFYNNAMQTGGGDETSDKIAAAEASSSLFTGQFFKLKKTDQYGEVVSGVEYTLYEVTLDANNKVTATKTVMTKTTEADGTAYFGHRTSDDSKVQELQKDKLYCLVETKAPEGYVMDSTPYYFEFKAKESDTVASPEGADLHQFVSGGTYSFTNQFVPASCSVPVKKTINGKEIAGDTEFSFTLKQASGTTVYTDADDTTEIPTNGINAKIKGSGEEMFDTLYFTKAGTYTFTMTEDDLDDATTKKGYSKDSNTFTVTIEVGTGSDNGLTVTSASFTSAKSSVKENLSTSVPTFDNTLHLTGTLTLEATKEVTNRTTPVQEGEFSFTVSAGGVVIAEKNADGTTMTDAEGKPVKKLFYTKEGGAIKIDIDIDQNDIGTKTYIISEVAGSNTSIKYTTDRVRVKVTIAEAKDEAGNAIVKATKCEYLTDAVFTNEYTAEGSLKLKGTKELKSSTIGSMDVRKGEFSFVVNELVGAKKNKVATGATESDGSITFTEIQYYESDIGTTHTYEVSEVEGSESYVKYTADPITVEVKVIDNGDGTLSTEETYYNKEGTKLSTDGEEFVMTFVNEYDAPVPTGIRVDILPYVMMIAIAACPIMLLTIYKRKKRSVRRR